MDPRIERLESMVKDYYKKHNSASHDWSHMERVLKYALIIAGKEARRDILIPAVLLHDIERDKDEHFKSGKPRKFLKEAGFSGEEIVSIEACIESHSTFSGKEPHTLEEKILFDADKLDSYGLLGIVRFFTFAGERGLGIEASLKDAFNRIENIDRRGFYTKEGEKMGMEGAKETFLFFYKLFKETGMDREKKKLERILIRRKGRLIGRLILLFI